MFMLDLSAFTSFFILADVRTDNRVYILIVLIYFRSCQHFWKNYAEKYTTGK